jgi:hypothetical protein
MTKDYLDMSLTYTKLNSIIEASPTPVVLSMDCVIALSNYIKQNASPLLGKAAGVTVVVC